MLFCGIKTGHVSTTWQNLKILLIIPRPPATSSQSTLRGSVRQSDLQLVPKYDRLLELYELQR